MATADVNRLWVNVSCFADGNLFAVYPKILAKIMANVQGVMQGPPDFDILLPSNEEWRTMIYYKLVEKQRAIGEDGGMEQRGAFLDRPRTAGPWDTTIPDPPTKRIRSCRIKSSISALSEASATVSSLVSPVTWTVSDIAKAACLLNDPPIHTEFGDEQEMRRVYTLIYDVFRYKNVLNQALNDMQFFFMFPEENFSQPHVWLLLYDLYHRRFAERETSDGSAQAADKLFPLYNLSAVEAALWGTRIRIAAAMSRLRIANSALRLNDMLPEHLKDEKVAKAANLASVTCWVNKSKIGKIKPEPFFEEIRQHFSLRVVPNNTKKLNPEHIRWNPLCPMFLTFHHSKREAIARSFYVRENILIMQNLSFSYGPAIFCKLLFQYNLTGTVIQSHINSPRATAYLATLLAENDQIIGLYAFGAGDRREEYENYMKELNIKNVKIFAHKFTDLEPDANVLAQVVGVFATPPNSYSAVNDPIDLVCSRGGDLALLEILTDTAETDEGQRRVLSILEEQRLTLRFAMTRPQIQFVLYETHSQLDAENGDLVNQVIHEVNRAAKYKHAELQGKVSFLAEKEMESENSSLITLTEINNNEEKAERSNMGTMDTKQYDSDSTFSSSSIESALEDDLLKSIEVPPTDEYQQQKLPDLCFNSDQCLRLAAEGCYLALLQRKEVTRFDAKYMIRMAEGRGLFGGGSVDSSKKNQKSQKQRRKENMSSSALGKRKRTSFEVERIAAPTHASVMRSIANLANTTSGNTHISCCPKHQPVETRLKDTPARLWWAETVRYLTRLRKSLVRQKLVSNNPSMLRAINKDKIMTDIKNIDDIIGCVERNKKVGTNIPVFPRLRLSREVVKIEKKPFPIFIKTVQLPWGE